MKLSLAMIAKNEAGILGHCLGSVQSLVDEIILVDTGSSDATSDIGRQFGARVEHFPWIDDFAAARNESLKYCTGDWVLILDADEAIDVLDHSLIRRACEDEGVYAYRLTLRNYFSSGRHSTLDTPVRLNESPYSEGREFSHYADFKGLRLCRRIPGLCFEGRIHELLDPCFDNRFLSITDLNAVIHHFGKLMKDKEIQKGRYYLDLALQDARKDPANPQFHFNVVQQGLTIQDWPTVLDAANTYMRLRSKVPPIIIFGAGVALQHLDRNEEALAHFDRLLQVFPFHASALTQRGISLAVLGRWEEARTSFRKAIQAQPGFIMPFLNLAEMEIALGRFPEARAVVEEGLGICPGDPMLLRDLVRLDLANQEPDRAVADAHIAIQRCPEGGDGMWHRLVALALQKKGDTEGALAILRQGREAFPGDPEIARLLALILG